MREVDWLMDENRALRRQLATSMELSRRTGQQAAALAFAFGVFIGWLVAATGGQP